MANALLSLAAGFGNGYMGAQRQAELDAERKKKDQRDQDEHDARMAERRRAEDERVALANAARPAAVDTGANGMTKPDYADNRDVGQPGEPGADAGGLVQGSLVNGKSSANPSADAAAYNAPDAVRARQAQVLDQQGKPGAAITLQNATLSQGAARRKEADEAWRQKVGMAMQAGHEGLAQLASQTEVGPLAGKKVKPVPSADGKSVTYNLVGDDGTLTPTSLTFPNDQSGVIQAGYMLDRAITPEHRYTAFQKDKELDRKSQADTDRFQYQQGVLANAADKISLTGQLAEARLAAQQAKGSGVPTREERLRYTSLFSDAGRRLAEANKTLGTLQRDVVFMSQANKPGTPQAAQLEEARQAIKDHSEERALYQGLLAGSQGTKTPALGDAKPSAKPAAASGPVKVSSKAERDKLAPGTKYVGPDGVTYVKQ